MSRDVASNPKLVPVTLEAVPNVAAEGLPAMFEAILKARRGRRVSFGAYVLRCSTVETRRQCAKFLRTDIRGNQVVTMDIFEDEKVPIIHRDPGGRNSVSIHHTTSGQVDVAVLVGSKFAAEMHSEAIPPLQEAHYLIDLSLVGSDHLSAPRLGLTSRLSADDVLIFDSSQPHVFRDVETGRRSEVLYLSPRPLS